MFGGLKIVTHENSVHAYYDYYGNLQAAQKGVFHFIHLGTILEFILRNVLMSFLRRLS